MALHKDGWGHDVTAADAAAVARLDGAILAYCGMRVDIGERMKTVFEADAEMPMALAAKTAFLKMFATAKMDAAAAKTHAQLSAVIAAGEATARERAHAGALGHYVAGDLGAACDAWEAILIDHPRDLFAIKLAQLNRFYLGQAPAMRGGIARALHGWSEAVPGHGYLLGSYAFALEEAGYHPEAERHGRRAIEIDPTDIWAAHAVAHVMEMQGHSGQGYGWLDALKGEWEGVHNFKHHAHWHRALFALDLGLHDDVLEIHDRDIWTEVAGDYLDISNAASLLWRLEEEGVDVGDRWAPVAALSAERVEEHALVFATCHFAMALAGDGGDGEGHADALDRLEAAQAAHMRVHPDTTFAHVWRAAGAAIVKAVRASRAGRPGEAVDHLLPVRADILRIGGSHAQRDVFERLLLSAALADGRDALARALISERLAARPEDRWTLACRRALDMGESGAAGATATA